MRALVTGSSGFIGSSLSTALIRAGWEVVPASRSTGCDITDRALVSSLARAEVVFHLAGTAGIENASARPHETYLNNIRGIINLLEYCRLNRVQKMVLASSYLYGVPDYLPVDENHRLSPNNPYARGKMLIEEICRAYCENTDLPIVALRIFNAYGPGQRGNMLLPSIMNQLTSGRVKLRDPKPKRDMVYIDDVVAAFIAATAPAITGFRAFNVASGRSISVEELVIEITRAWGQPIDIEYTGENRPNEVMDTMGCNRLIARELGWQPRVSLAEGISETTAWWKNQATNTTRPQAGEGH